MSLCFQISARQLASWSAMALVVLSGCRQLGTQPRGAEPTPIAPSAPAFAPADRSSSELPIVPPVPPAAAKRSKSLPADFPGGFSRPSLGEPSEVAPVGATEPAESEDETVMLVPPSMIDLEELVEKSRVPSPRDVDDEETILATTPASPRGAAVVELDVTEFLAELEQTPAPVKAQPVTVVETITPMTAVPRKLENFHSSLEPWSSRDANHGIMITPGPTGTGNRLDGYPTPLWNRSVVGPNSLPAWNAAPQWAGQNSDWGGRQFR